jgi:hypothetical protein
MASARARMGALRRKIGKRQKTANVASGIFSTLGTVAAFGAGQAKKAETAWGEYEAGYKELTGEDYTGKKGWFSKPEGTLNWKGREYDRANIQKAGSFLSSDSATALFAREGGDVERAKYMKRTVPGRESTTTADPMDWKGKFLQAFQGKPIKKPGSITTTPQTTEQIAPDYYKQLHSGTAEQFSTFEKYKSKGGMYQDGEWIGSASEPATGFTGTGGGIGVKTPVFDVNKYQDYGKQYEGTSLPPKLNYMEALDGNRMRTIQQGKSQNLRPEDWEEDEWGGGENQWLNWGRGGGGKGGY